MCVKRFILFISSGMSGLGLKLVVEGVDTDFWFCERKSEFLIDRHSGKGGEINSWALRRFSLISVHDLHHYYLHN